VSKGGRQIAKAAVMVMALFALSRLLGVIRQMVIAAQFGTSGDLDAYLAAARIPETIFLIVAGGALGSAFIPAFAGHLAKEDYAGAWRLTSAVINLVVIALTVTAGLIAILAPTLVCALIAPGFDDRQQALTTSLLRLMLLSPIIFGVSGIVMGTLNAHQHFFLPALAPSLYNLSIIGGTLLLGPRLGVRGIAVGVVAGSALHLLVQMPALLHYGARYSRTLGLHSPSVREVGRLMAPRVLGTAIVQLNLVVNNSLASTMGRGAVSAINYAWLLMLLPQGIFAQAVGTAAFPTFAEQAARGERKEMRSALSATLRAVSFLSIPATMGLLVLGQPLVGLLFERGAFDTTSTADVVWALAFFALGLVGHSGLEVIARAFYALHDTFTPVWVGGLAMVLNLVLSLTLPGAFEAWGWIAHGGLALANSIATLLETAALLLLIRGRLDGIEGRRTLTGFAKSGLAALVMGAALLGWRTLLPDAPLLLVGAGGIALGMAVYLGAALLLRAEELQIVVDMIRSRRKRGW
jgi:putative peptidoglycan lipid II flippase